MDLTWMKSNFRHNASVKYRMNGKFQLADANIYECELAPCPRCEFCNGWYRSKREPADVVIRCGRPTPPQIEKGESNGILNR